MRFLPLCLLLAIPAFGRGLWERRSPYPVRLTEVSGAAVGKKLYMLCGIGEGSPPLAVHTYDTVHDTWSQGAPIPIAGGADHCNVAAVDGKLYLLGAIRIGSPFIDGNTYAYDPALDRWETVSRMNIPRGASGVAAIGRKIYVAGGLAQNGRVSNDFEVFDTETRLWAILGSMPSARDHLTAQAVGGKFYALAGRAGGLNSGVSNTEEFDPATSIWRQRARIPVARGGVGSGVVQGRIVVFGGEGDSGGAGGTFEQTHAYDPVQDVWQELAPMNYPRHGLYGVTVDDRIFAPGGGPFAGASYSSTHEVYYPPPPVFPVVRTVVNAASYDQTLAPGSVISIGGTNLAFGEQAATAVPIPVSLNAVFVRIDGIRVPLFYAGPNQVNALLPLDLPSLAGFTLALVNVQADAAPVRFTNMAEAAPGIFTLDFSGRGQGAVLVSGTELVAGSARSGAARPSRRGEYIEIYCTGLGRVTNPPEPGRPAGSSPYSETLLRPVVTIGGVEARVIFSGLAPGFAGAYQVNAQIAANTPVGNAVPLQLRMGAEGRLSNSVTIAVSE